MFERPQDDESQPEQWAVQGGVRLQLADWLATSLANTTEILYSNLPPNPPDLGPHVVELDQYQNVPYSHSDFSDVYFSFAKWCSRSWKEPVPFNFDWIALNPVMILTIWPLPHPLLNEEHMFYFVLDFGDHFCNFFLLPLIYGLMRNTFILIMQMSSAKHNTNIDFFFLDKLTCSAEDSMSCQMTDLQFFMWNSQTLQIILHQPGSFYTTTGCDGCDRYELSYKWIKFEPYVWTRLTCDSFISKF